MRLVSLRTWNFRNLAPAKVEWTDGVNLILGSNGQGKTNLLEAVAVLGNLRSFRTPHHRRVVRHHETGWRVTGTVAGSAGTFRLEQVVDLGPPLRRELRINGAPVGTPSYLAAFPVFAFTSGDRDLVAGPPEVRRAFLDRFAFLLHEAVYGELNDFRRVLRQRNAALTGRASDVELAAWDRQLAASAARVVRRRGAASLQLGRGFTEVYGELSGPGFPEVQLVYRGDGWVDGRETSEPLEKQYLARLTEHRERDRRLGYTVDGPQRHDLAVEADGRPARELLSAGQTKVVSAAMRLAAVRLLEAARGEPLTVVVDDVDAELDDDALRRFVTCVAQTRQLLMSSAHGEVVERLTAPANTLWVRGGRVDGGSGAERAHE